MAVELIDKIKPKNNGTFPMMDAEDIEHNGKRLPSFLPPAVTAQDNNKVLAVVNGAWGAKSLEILPQISSYDTGKVLTVVSGQWMALLPKAELPAVTATDNGKVLTVSNGTWAAKASETELPTVTTADDGKLLQVVNGQFAVVAVADSAVAKYVDDYINSALGGDY